MSDISYAPKIALIGGGTGSFTLLSELKHFTPNISALVAMSDDGGSTGILRDELGVLPPGDIRQCLVALSDNPELREVFTYRFGEGSLANHSLGNLIVSGLEKKYGGLAEAIKVLSRLLHLTGAVIPMSLDQHTLVMQDGQEVIRGEYLIGSRATQNADPSVSLDPPATINPEAEGAILQADLVVLAPGNLYGSLLPALMVGGVAETLRQTSATKVMVANLVTKPGQTDDWHVVDYVQAIERHIGQGQFDVVLYNQEAPRPELLALYAADGEYPVGTDQKRFGDIAAQSIGASLVASETHLQDPNDKLIRRTLIRHDAVAVGRQLMRLYFERPI
jgi:uncharacterized cofD-like protein